MQTIAKTHLEPLEERRELLCLRLSKANTKNPQKMFPLFAMGVGLTYAQFTLFAIAHFFGVAC